MKLKIEQLDSSVKGRVIRKTYKRRNAKLNRRSGKGRSRKCTDQASIPRICVVSQGAFGRPSYV